MESVLDNQQVISAYANITISICFFVGMILLFLAHEIGRKPKITKKSSELTGLISPILAEVIVDGKIDIKNLILTTIAELQIKRNVAIVNDNVIELIHKNNLNMYELYLVDLIFLEKKSVTFGEINDRFRYNMKTIEDFKIKMSKITEEIQSRLYEIKVFSKRKTFALNIVSYISMLMLINFPTIVLKTINSNSVAFPMITIFFSIIASIIFFSRLTANSEYKMLFEPSFGFGKSKSSTLYILIMLEAIVFISLISSLNVSILGIIGVYIVNAWVMKLTKNNVLSEKGLEERRKVLELRNFLKDYDLRKTENGESYIVWNKYFAYSAAFGISNPVISEIYKLWNKLDITLSFTQNII